MNDFIAIDVETANPNASSICSIGCVKVRDGVIVDTYYSLVHPEPDYYWRKFTAIHGLSDQDTWNAPPFDSVWLEIKKWSEGLPFVAHNARFDYSCIKAACKVYQLEPPDAPFLCTLTAARRQVPKFACASYSLPSLCAFFGIQFDNHHNALADSEGCAKLAMVLL